MRRRSNPSPSAPASRCTSCCTWRWSPPTSAWCSTWPERAPTSQPTCASNSVPGERPSMAPDLSTPAGYLPVIFMALMGISLFLYVVLDGYDLGVGILLPGATDHEKDIMVASIGPFWDANETWLVLGIGLLLVAFPVAHGIVLTSLYLPV